MDNEILVNILWLAFAAMALTLLILYLKKNEKINSLQSAVINLKTTLEEMDEQAKLIVRTDIALSTGVGVCFETGRAEHLFQREPDQLVVINDMDGHFHRLT